MSVPELASGATSDRRLRPLSRLAGFAVAHPAALGVAFLLLCGWKFVFGLHAVMDIDPDHETAYLDYLLGANAGPVPPEYSPLYVALYAIEHLLAHDPIDLFYLNIALLTVALPVSFFVYLMARRVPWVLALPVSVYLLIVMANLPTRPKMMHLALIVVFLSLALFARLGERPERLGFLLVICAALSLIRPELIYALFVVAVWCLYRLARQRLPWRLAASVAAAALVIAALYWHFGLPLFGERSVFALAWHFSANYLSWHGETGAEAFAGDYWGIYHSVFGQAASIPAAFFANPGAFLHHVFTNLVHAPTVLAGDFLFHYNLFLPRYRLFTIAEGVLLAALLALALLRWRNGSRAAAGGASRAASLLPTAKNWIATAASQFPEAFLLLLFAAPSAAMIVILYPRHHYVAMTGLSLLAFALVAVAGQLRSPAMTLRTLLLLPLLLALVPSLGSAGVLLNRPYGEAEAGPRPALAEALFLRSLNLKGPITLLEASDPGISPYVAANFRSVSDLAKPHGLAAFLRDNKISAVLEDGRLRVSERFANDPEWKEFRADPGRFGFAALAVPEAHAILYIRQGLSAGAGSPASRL